MSGFDRRSVVVLAGLGAVLLTGLVAGVRPLEFGVVTLVGLVRRNESEVDAEYAV